ncbi:FBP domain-containing protein [Microbacterium rhizomatis]|uniref:FBP domain-containing protein n=1 Tax=Microbacterium rhizomatis TaxID=1631477 RepID=A0A5J5J744_9MICO|nr:FBP domain-containing protein [Microbacterium rhizomatis]KAA9110603.1 FBP domain-containing protein [Microbacterium rhizomatis]
MNPLSETLIRGAFVNASVRERKAISMPTDLDELSWDRLSYLGWRDAKSPQFGYAVVEIDEEPFGVILRATDAKLRARAQCSWCEDVTLPNDVVFYSAKRGGAAGRRGDTVGTLACANFECSANARKLPPMAYLGFDAEAARDRRIEALGEHVRAFVRLVRDGD